MRVGVTRLFCCGHDCVLLLFVAGLSYEDYERQRTIEAMGMIAACTVVIFTTSWLFSRGV
jgi:hypothetical protein